MNRIPLTLLASCALLSLSCGLRETRAPIDPPRAAPSAPRASDDPRVETIARFLEAQRTGLVAEEREHLARAIVDAAARHELEPELVLAVIHVESRFYNFAVSHVGAMGLMQILPSTAEELAARSGMRWEGPQTLFDPVVNVRLGTAYVKQLLERYGSVRTALAAYNWGPGRIDRRLRAGVPLPTRYPQLVMAAYRRS